MTQTTFIPEQALFLLFTQLVAITPAGWLPYVTLTSDPERPFGAVIVAPDDTIAAMGTGKSIQGLVCLLDTKLGRPVTGCGETQA